MVLLKNNGSILPLKKGGKLALFVKGLYDYVKGGGGSGDVSCEYIKGLADVLKEKEKEGKVSLFTESLAFYKEYVETSYKKGGVPGLIPEPALPSSILKSASVFTDTAIFAISRFSGENWDRTIDSVAAFLDSEICEGEPVALLPSSPSGVVRLYFNLVQYAIIFSISLNISLVLFILK